MANTDKFYLNNASLPTANTQMDFDIEKIKNIQKCKKDIVYFAENYFTIVNIDEGKQLIKLYKPQKRILKSLQKHNRCAVVASRQSGKTTLLTIYVLWMACFNKDKSVLIVANKQDTAKKILERIRTAYELLPNWLKPGVKDYSVTRLKFANDSAIDISTTSSSAARGSSISCLVVDEAAHISPHLAEEFFKSVMPIVSSGKKSKIFLVSTANGTSNEFYKIYKGAEAMENGWKAEHIRWDEIPGRDAKWREQALADVGGSLDTFKQEYENCFLDSGEISVDKAIIDELRRLCTTPTILNTEHYKVWVPPKKNHIYAIGVDTSDGVGGNYSVANVMDITDLTNIEQVAVYSNNKIEPYSYAKQLYEMTQQWGNPLLLIENNNQGGQVVMSLKKTYHYEHIIDYEYGNDDIVYERSGILSTLYSKAESVSNMRYWINTLNVVRINDIRTVQEMETFVKHPNGVWKKQNGDGFYDDRMMALIWSLFILHNPIAKRYLEVLLYDDKGRPLKIQRNELTDEKYFGLEVMKREYEEGDPMPTFMQAYGEKDNEMADLEIQGWRTF